MRIIPKKTKVAMEFFKGVELMDVAVGLIGAVIATAVFMSNLPFKLWIIIGVVIIFAAFSRRFGLPRFGNRRPSGFCVGFRGGRFLGRRFPECRF